MLIPQYVRSLRTGEEEEELEVDKMLPLSFDRDTNLKRRMEQDHSNTPIPMKPRRWTYYTALLFVVGPIYAVTPLSWAYILAVAFGRAPLWRPLLAYALFEAAFSIYYQYLAYIVRNGKSQIRPRDIHQLQLLFTRMLQAGLSPPQSPTDPQRPASPAELIAQLTYEDPRATDFRHHLRNWFHGAPWSHITRKSMSMWLAWSIFDKRLESLGPIEGSVVEEALRLIEKRSGGRLAELPPDGQDHIIPIRLTLDSIDIWSRPAALYVFYACANTAAHWWYRYVLGFTSGSHNGIEYLVRIPKPSLSGEKQSTPIVLLHGLGFGVAQYFVSFSYILARIPKNTPILIPYQPHISQTILHPGHLAPPGRKRWIHSLKSIIENQGWDEGVTMISHSKGSLPHAWMLKAHPEMVKRSALVDPVTFCLWEGDLCRNFVYKSPRGGLDLIMRYFAGTEVGTANVINRHFDWFSNSLWFEEIPNARDHYYAAFWIAGADGLIDGERTRKYLARHGVDKGLYWEGDTRHGQALIPGKNSGLGQVIDWLLMEEPATPDFSGSETEGEEETIDLMRGLRKEIAKLHK